MAVIECSLMTLSPKVDPVQTQEPSKSGPGPICRRCMATSLTPIPTDKRGSSSSQTSHIARPHDLTLAYWFTGALAIVGAIASAVGKLHSGVFRETDWTVGNAQGTDLVILAVAIPTVVISMLLTTRGSIRAQIVWLFSSGPLGREDPQPPGDPVHLDELVQVTHACGHHTFVGKLDKSKLSLGERLAVKLVKAPEGDFRNWEAIRSWVRDIAATLEAPVALGV